MRRALRRSGLAHLVAIDGFKQALVAGLVELVAARLLGRRLAWLPVLAGIVGYTLLTGGHASAVRAGLMIGFSSVAAALGRVPDPLAGLALAALLMVAIQPSVLLDVGFQLSCSATLGLILLWPRMRRLLRGLPRPIAEPAGLTLAVTLATLPISLSVFEEVSLVSPIAHIVAVPLLPLVMLGAGLVAITSSWPGLGVAAAWLAWMPTSALAHTILVFGNLPGAALSTGRIAPAAAVVLAAVLVAWSGWWLPECESLRRRAARWGLLAQPCMAPLAALCTAALAVSLLLVTRPDGRLHVDPIAAGSAQAVLIRAPSGQTALVTRGVPAGSELANEVAARLHVWEHSLNTVVVLGPARGTDGLEAMLERYPADQMLDATGAVRIDFGNLAVDVQVAADGLTVRSAPTTSAATPAPPN
jgi:competence protein ComEC